MTARQTTLERAFALGGFPRLHHPVFAVEAFRKVYLLKLAELTLGPGEPGRIAKQATAAVLVTMGETIVLTSVVCNRDAGVARDFFPLTVDYQERTYAAGKIPGGFFKREGKPPEKEILTSRLIDRPIRPLFPKGLRNDVQVIITTLSADQENDPSILGIVGASSPRSFGGRSATR